MDDRADSRGDGQGTHNIAACRSVSVSPTEIPTDQREYQGIKGKRQVHGTGERKEGRTGRRSNKTSVFLLTGGDTNRPTEMSAG